VKSEKEAPKAEKSKQEKSEVKVEQEHPKEAKAAE